MKTPLQKIAVLVSIVSTILIAACAATNVPAKIENSDRAPISGGLQRDEVEIVQDDFVVVSILDLGPSEIALVDAGNAADAGPILSALAKRGLGPDAVKAILPTHGDSDHTRGSPGSWRSTPRSMDRTWT